MPRPAASRGRGERFSTRHVVERRLADVTPLARHPRACSGVVRLVVAPRAVRGPREVVMEAVPLPVWIPDCALPWVPPAIRAIPRSLLDLLSVACGAGDVPRRWGPLGRRRGVATRRRSNPRRVGCHHPTALHVSRLGGVHGSGRGTTSGWRTPRPARVILRFGGAPSHGDGVHVCPFPARALAEDELVLTKGVAPRAVGRVRDGRRDAPTETLRTLWTSSTMRLGTGTPEWGCRMAFPCHVGSVGKQQRMLSLLKS